MSLVNHNDSIASLEAEMYDEDGYYDYQYYDYNRCDNLVQGKQHLESFLSKRMQTTEAEKKKNTSLTTSRVTAQQSLVCCQQEKAGRIIALYPIHGSEIYRVGPQPQP
jgi:hypothetical protein